MSDPDGAERVHTGQLRDEQSPSPHPPIEAIERLKYVTEGMDERQSAFVRYKSDGRGTRHPVVVTFGELWSFISSYEERGRENDHLRGVQDEHALFDAETDLAFKDLDHEIADLKASLSQAQDRIAALESVLDEFSSEYDGFENGDGEPCPTLMKARSLLSTPKGKGEA